MTRTEAKKHEHEWFPVAMDFDRRFMVLECTECTERVWANVHDLQPEEDI